MGHDWQSQKALIFEEETKALKDRDVEEFEKKAKSTVELVTSKLKDEVEIKRHESCKKTRTTKANLQKLHEKENTNQTKIEETVRKDYIVHQEEEEKSNNKLNEAKYYLKTVLCNKKSLEERLKEEQ